jgi:hypothetical protein
MISPDICTDAVRKHGKFDLVVSRQVLEHICDFDNFFTCIDRVIKDEGLLFIDVPDFAPGRELGDISVLWEEHVNYFTEDTFLRLFAERGFKVMAAKKYNFSGGSLAIIARRGAPRGTAVNAKTSVEAAERFSDRAREYRVRIRRTLTRLKQRGVHIAIYGAGCRACTFTNFHGLGELIDVAIDDQRERQGLFMPGSRIAVRPPDALKDFSGQQVCLLAVNNENEARVSARLRDALKRRVEIFSIFSPADIWGELSRLETL